MIEVQIEQAVIIATNHGCTRREQLQSPGQTEYEAEVIMFSRGLTQGEKLAFDKLFETYAREKTAGTAAAEAGRKQKENPHTGGSVAWWGWHRGYTEQKSKAAAALRRERRV